MTELVVGNAECVDRIEPGRVRAQLARILADPSFTSAPQLSRLLAHLVETALTGDRREVKEYSLGVEHFGRGKSFDPSIDTIVRSHARRLRQRLDAYYVGAGRTDAIVIDVPKGHYYAEFRANDAPITLPAGEPDAASPSAARSHRPMYLSIATCIIVAITAGGWWWREQHRIETPRDRSVAVLRFVPMSNDASIKDIADGLAEELVNALTEHAQLKVASRTASFAVSTQVGPAAAASLGVAYVVEGSVRPFGDSYRVTAQLIRGRDGMHQWSHAFDFGRGSGEMEATAHQIALHALRYLDTDVQLAEVRPQTPNETAFASYAKAFRLHMDLYADGNVREQIANNNEKAIELDPGFAEPYRLRGLTAVDHDREKTLNAKRAAFAHYLALRPDSGVGHADVAWVQFQRLDLAAADATLRRARALDPNHPWPYVVSAWLAMRRGTADEAIAFWKRALDLDGTFSNGHYQYAIVLLTQGQYDEADRQFELATRLDPNGVGRGMTSASGRVLGLVGQVRVSLDRGRHDEFTARFERAYAEFGPDELKHMLPAAGRETELRQLMAQWDAGTRHATSFDRFVAHYGLGEYDAAVGWASRAIDERKLGYSLRLKFWPEINDHPGFAALLAKLDAQEISH